MVDPVDDDENGWIEDGLRGRDMSITFQYLVEALAKV